MPTDRDEKPDVQKFLTDPRFAHDRGLIEATAAAWLEREAGAAAERRKRGEAGTGFFDRLFSAIFPDDDGDDNIFDGLFGGKRRR